MEDTIKGKDRNAGVLERLRALEDAGLIETAKRAAVSSVIALLVTAAPLLAVVMPAVNRLQESMDKRQPDAAAPHPPVTRSAAGH